MSLTDFFHRSHSGIGGRYEVWSKSNKNVRLFSICVTSDIESKYISGRMQRFFTQSKHQKGRSEGTFCNTFFLPTSAFGPDVQVVAKVFALYKWTNISCFTVITTVTDAFIDALDGESSRFLSFFSDLWIGVVISDTPAQVWKDSGQCQRSKNCVPDIDARHAVCQQPCSRVWLNLNARVCPPTPSCPPPPPQLPKRRRRLPPNRPSTGGTTHNPPRRYNLRRRWYNVPVPGVRRTTLRAGTELSRHGTGMSHHPQHPYLF